MSIHTLVTSHSSPYNQDMSKLPEEYSLYIYSLIERNAGYFSKLSIIPFAAGEFQMSVKQELCGCGF